MISMEHKHTHRHREQTRDTKGEWGGVRKGWEFGVRRSKVLYE